MGLNSFQTSGNSPGDRDASCHVGILGFGAVGAAVASRLTGPDPIPHLRLTCITDQRARDKRSRQTDSLANLTWTERFDDLIASDVDIIVVSVAAGAPAVDYVRAALLAGKSVVTANRKVIAHHGPALLALAERQGRQLRFEAAVGGAMPIVRTLGEALTGDRVLRIEAILNGTSNFVLSRMEKTGCSMDDAIAEACGDGYAEVDPSVDLDGGDAGMKLAILCALGFGLRVLPESIETRTTAHIGPENVRKARLRDRAIRQIAHAEYDWQRSILTAWVAPMFVTNTSLFARTEGPQNAAVITCAHAGEITVTGRGAGSDASAVSIVSDLVAIAKDRAAIVPAPVLVEPHEIKGLSKHAFAEAV